MLKPLGNRLIVKPEPARAESASGILIPETAGTPPAMTGTVVSVGRGPATAHRVRQATFARILRLIEEVSHRSTIKTFRVHLEDAIAQMAVDDVSFSEVAEGDYVAFAFTSGHNMTVDGEPYIVLTEDDLQAVWQAEKETAA